MNRRTICISEEDGCAMEKRRTSPASSHSEELNKEKIILTNIGRQRYGTWSKAKLLELIRGRFKRFAEAQQGGIKLYNETTNEKRLWVAVHSGLYTIRVLKQLLKQGMSLHTIIKTMKLGLISLNSCELSYFKCFNIDPYLLEFENMWAYVYSCELISNLRAAGISEPNCWHIIVHGVALQSPCMLQHLLLCGIDIPGILNWQSPVNPSSEKVILFLKQIGMEQEIIQFVEQYGIDEETEQILVDIGLHQVEEESHETVCNCSLTVLESDISELGVTQSMSKLSKSDSVSTDSDKIDYVQHDYQRGDTTGKNTVEEFTAQRNDYLRQNVMVPVAWAMARTLKYKPSDFIYYMAYQLLKWRNIDRQKKDGIKNVIALATIKMDKKFIMEKNAEKEKFIQSQNEEVLRNIPCSRCKQELNVVKQACSKCIKTSRRTSKDCKFPEICSSCKIQSSSKIVCQFSPFCSSCKIIENSYKNTDSQLKKPEVYQLPRFYSSCRIADSPSENFDCQFPRLCSSCKLNDSRSKIFGQCEFPQFCSSCKITDRPGLNLEACQCLQDCSSCKITNRPSKKLETSQSLQHSSCKITDRSSNN